MESDEANYHFLVELLLLDPNPSAPYDSPTTTISTASSPQLLLSIDYKRIRRVTNRSPDGNETTLLHQSIVDRSPPGAEAIRLGTLGMLYTRPIGFLLILSEILATRLNISDPSHQAGISRVIGQGIRDLMIHGRVSHTRKEVRLQLKLRLFCDLVFDDEEQYELAMAAAAAAAAASMRNNCGMVPTAPEALMKMVAAVEVEMAAAGENCTICLDELTVAKAAAAMPCKHVFHEECIVAWLKTSHYCPICRFEMPTGDDDGGERVESSRTS